MPAVFGIVTCINGKRRTPKIEALHRMIERVLCNLEIDKQRPILSNGWFSRMLWMATSLFNTTSVKKKPLHSHAYTVLSHAKCERHIRSRFVATCYDNHCLGNALHLSLIHISEPTRLGMISY